MKTKTRKRLFGKFKNGSLKDPEHERKRKKRRKMLKYRDESNRPRQSPSL